MSQPENNFDDKLNQLYKIHKSDNKLSPQEKKHLIIKAKNKNKFNWINTLQISLTAIALFTLFTFVFSTKKNTSISIDEVVYIPNKCNH